MKYWLQKIFHSLPISDKQRMQLAFSVFRLTGNRLRNLPSYRVYLRQNKWQNACVPEDLPTYRAEVLSLHFSAEQGPAMIMISHIQGGGTEQHVNDLTARLEAEGWRIFHLQYHDAQHLRLIGVTYPAGAVGSSSPRQKDFRGEPLYYRWPQDNTTLAEDWATLGVCHLHLHHTVDLPEDFLAHFGAMAEAAKLPYDFTVHDYFSICPRFTLYDEVVHGYCGEPEDVRKCSACVRHLGSPVGKQVDVAAWRQKYSVMLQSARKVFVPDSDVAIRLQRYFPQVEFTLRPHPETWALVLPTEQGEARSVGFGALPHSIRKIVIIGGIAPHKGSRVLLQCAQDARKRNLPLAFTLIGYSDIDHELKAVGNVHITGFFQPEDLAQKLREERFHFAFLPSVIPETYNYVLSQCWQHGLQALCFDIGAIASRIRAAPHLGRILPLEWYYQPEKTNDALLAFKPIAFTGPLPLTDYASVTRDYYGLALV